ncbi:MAG: PcfK-like family protein [Prevotella sp.]|uniref:PcfK-like family protein n=1 Tax=Prevotella sp. TaxID=59823 RepID=UPI002A82F3BF|nr:PcfK-like family protein [Prevotella sp.]MDY4020087.1 PcfK-like family protein [Prevotella sp.]MDY6130165.1 PcfK-like family protein [Prevotella sp.]
MKGTEHFKQVIKNYLDQRAQEDELFRAKYETTQRTIDDVVTFILNEVKKSGCCGYSDEEIFSLAVHAIDEPSLEIGKPIDCNVVVNHHIELTEEEKAQQKAIALKRFQEEELRKIQQRNSRPKVSKPQENKQNQPSLFDFCAQ